MGHRALPSISKIEEVLDILTNPDKYLQYMKDFKAAYDEAKQSLGDLQTKEEADAYLSTAHDQHVAMLKFMESSKNEIADLRAKHDADVEARLRGLELREQHLAEMEAKAKVDADSLVASFEEFDKTRNILHDDLQRQYALIDEKTVRLDSELALLSERKAKAAEALRAYSDEFQGAKGA